MFLYFAKYTTFDVFLANYKQVFSLIKRRYLPDLLCDTDLLKHQHL